MSTSAPLPESDSGVVKYVISLRADRPIAKCELAPHPFLYIKGGTMDNAARAKMMDSNPHTFSFVWRKSPRRPLCESPTCARREVYDPIQWCRSTLGGCMLHCAVCERGGVLGNQSAFCSKSCFIDAWKSHCQLRHKSLNFNTQRNAQLRDVFVADDYPLELGRKPSFDISSDGRNQIISSVASSSGSNSVKDILLSQSAASSSSSSPYINESSDWPIVSTDKSYTPTEDDIGSILRIEVKALAVNGGQVLAGPLNIFTDPILSAPRCAPKRQLLTIGQGSQSVSTLLNSAGTRFRVISYNILAEIYATKQAYPYCESWALLWPYRLQLIAQELEDAQGDIVCLQEVQADHYEQYLSPFMHERGFDGVYKQKSRESMGQYMKIDGCATFWRRSKFMMIENFNIEFNEQARKTATNLNMDEADQRWYMNKLLRDNIAQVVVLEVISRSAVRLPRQSMQVCVANTHLYANHHKPDVKLWQAYSLLKQLEQFILTRDVALILCGDLNSEPSSAVYELLFDGALTQQHPELHVTDSSAMVLPELHTIMHNIDLESVMFAATGSEPEFTNFTAKFKGTLDYIWYSPNRLRVMGVAQIPDLGEFETAVGVGLPSANYPSDHIMVCTDLAFNITGAGLLTKTQQQKRGGGGSGGGGGGASSSKSNGGGMLQQSGHQQQQQAVGGLGGAMGRGGLSSKSLRNGY